MVPIKTMSGESLGVLQLLNATDARRNFGPFAEEIIPLEEALASQASVAMENGVLLHAGNSETTTGARSRRSDGSIERCADEIIRSAHHSKKK